MIDRVPELLIVDWFQNVVRDLQPQCFPAIRKIIVSRYNNKCHIRVFQAAGLDDLQAIHNRNVYIHDHDIRHQTVDYPKRLDTIREYAEFGSGFKIAMRDLEIRGAGNLLGPEQSGYMMSVGYDMYLKLLNDAVLEQQGREVPVRVECSADLTVPAYIPESYVPSAEQRMDLYRRIAALRTPADEADLMDELLDRYGDVPQPVTALLNVAMLRAAAMETGITDITQKGRQLLFSFDGRIDPSALLAVCTMASYRSRTQLTAGASRA